MNIEQTCLFEAFLPYVCPNYIEKQFGLNCLTDENKEKINCFQGLVMLNHAATFRCHLYQWYRNQTSYDKPMFRLRRYTDENKELFQDIPLICSTEHKSFQFNESLPSDWNIYKWNADRFRRYINKIQTHKRHAPSYLCVAPKITAQDKQKYKTDWKTLIADARECMLREEREEEEEEREEKKKKEQPKVYASCKTDRPDEKYINSSSSSPSPSSISSTPPTPTYIVKPIGLTRIRYNQTILTSKQHTFITIYIQIPSNTSKDFSARSFQKHISCGKLQFTQPKPTIYCININKADVITIAQRLKMWNNSV